MSEKGYLGITRVIMPYECICRAYDHMRRAGQQGMEGVAVFAGKENEEIFKIEQVIVPQQKAMSLEDGLLYSVDGNELHRINLWLYENKMSLIAQIHSHPSRAYHSSTDDDYPIIATIGGLSIVVPDFASRPIHLSTWAVYRLSGQNKWVELSPTEKDNLIQIIK